ncbi:MAG: alpha/beta fold hydrolase [Chloroflexota bacterium]
MQPTIRQARTSDGVSIAYAVAGPAAGPVVVMLPGIPLSDFAAEWRIPSHERAYERLTSRLRLVQFDGRGTGHSQRDVEEVGLEAFLRDLDAVLDAEAIGRVVLVGFYHSVMEAIAWAARHSDRAAGLILFGGGPNGWSLMSGAATQALLTLIERDWDTFVESITHAWLGWPAGDEGRLAADWFRTATTPAVARATLEAASEIDVTGDLPDVRCPVLVLHRAEATVIPLGISEALVAGLPNARLTVLPGQSASLFIETADEAVDAIVAFALDPARVVADGPAPSTTSAATPASPPDAGLAGPTAIPASLTNRELEVLRLIAAGESNGEIAAALGISINTVERHVTTIYRKVEARGRTDATAWAIRHGLA